MSDADRSRLGHAAVGAGTFVLGALMAWGAAGLPTEAGYAGVGPNFLPWVVSVALMFCGVLLVWQARRGVAEMLQAPAGMPQGQWRAVAWVAAGVLLNAALITRIGFVLACTLCFLFAVRGLRLGEGRPVGGLRQGLLDAVTGLAIAAPTYWLFTKLLSINLPGLVRGGWI